MRLGNAINPIIGLTGLFALALSATIAVAESNETIQIKVRTDDGLSESVSIDNLDVGATEVFLTESGREVLVTRDEEGLTLELDGRQIDVSLPKIESLSGDDLAHHRVMFLSPDGEKHVLHGEGDAVFFSDDNVFIEDGMEKRVIIETEGLHECDDEECVRVKALIGDEHGDIDWVDADSDRAIMIKRVQGGDVEVIDLAEDADVHVNVEAHTEGDGEHEVVVIKRKVKVHTEEEID